MEKASSEKQACDTNLKAKKSPSSEGLLNESSSNLIEPGYKLLTAV